ncbi:MAG: chaperone NapD [Gammaproteobacteria bacterium]
MNVSGILVVVPPEHVAASMDTLSHLNGVEVHHCDTETGRIIVTQEAESIQAEVDGLKRIKALPHVILAEMAYHCFEEDGDLLGSVPPELDELEGMNPVPPFLNK